MRIQAAVVVNDDHAGQGIRRIRGRDEVAANRPRALRRLDLDVARGDALVVLRDALPGCEVGNEALEDRRGGHSADGPRRGTVQKIAAADVTVHELVE